MKTTLLIMAAGLGSRYGGNKQIDHIGWSIPSMTRWQQGLIRWFSSSSAAWRTPSVS